MVRVLGIVMALALLAVPASASARTAAAAKDGRPNILVVMTDDQNAADIAQMPNVKRLLAARGTTFTNAVDSFPLCCPSRATFITGQYAHNHGVLGNFFPYGWYGMKDRRNILPLWLQKAGYHTGLVGKWLNGYGAVDAHGEVPSGFDVWRGLLDVSAYDYFNFVMNRNGTLKAWGDTDFAHKLVEFANIEVTANPGGLAGVLNKLASVMGPGPYKYWGAQNAKDYSPDVTGKITEGLVRSEKRSKQPFFIWWAPAAPHREDVATTLMQRPGRDPRPAPRYEQKSASFKLPRPPSFNEADLSDKPTNMKTSAPPLTDAQVAQLQLDYEGRMGSLLAVDDHVKALVDILTTTHQLDNTLIVFVSDNGWLQGEHRIPGDKFLPYEESLRVPLILSGPGIPKGKTVTGQVSNLDFAPTLVDVAKARAGRTMDGASLMPALRSRSTDLDSVVEIEAPRPLFEDPVPVNAWDRPYKGVRTNRYTYVVYNETGDEELYDRRKDPSQMSSVAADPAYAGVKAKLEADLARLDTCSGAQCRARAGGAARLAGLHDARYCEIIELKGAPPTGVATVWNTIGLNKCPAAQWNAFQAGPLATELGDTAVVLNGPRHFLMDSVSVGSKGIERSFHGLAMRKVAAIDIKTAADLVQTPYTDRTIKRDNTWRWKKGRTVFELVAPGGDTYVMQSYAQIKDPTLTLAKLGKLGSRLTPPTGWRYRTRKLDRDLALSAGGGATITQDELQNTYQLATIAKRGRRARHAVSIEGVTRTVAPATAGTLEDHGTLTGKPFGKGSIVLVAKLANASLEATFRLTFPEGSITGTTSMPFVITGNEIDFNGTTRFTGGTGIYRGITGSALKTHDHNTLDGQNGRITVTGSATY